MRCMTSSALIYTPQVNEIPPQRNGVTGPSSTTHIKLYKFGQITSPNISHMKSCTDLNLGEGICVQIDI